MPVNVNTFGAIGLNFLNDTFSQAKQTILIEHVLTPADGQGGFTKIWQEFACVEGFVIQKSQSEPQEDGRLVTKAMYKIHIAPVEGITEEMKLTINEEEYRILGINNLVAIDQWLIIDAEKGFNE